MSVTIIREIKTNPLSFPFGDLMDISQNSEVSDRQRAIFLMLMIIEWFAPVRPMKMEEYALLLNCSCEEIKNDFENLERLNLYEKIG